MAKVAVEHFFNGPTSSVYDSTKTFLGTLCRQVTGASFSDCYVGPAPIIVARPGEAPTSITAGFPHVINEPGDRALTNWVFLVSQAAAATTRPIVMYEHSEANNTLTAVGTVTPTVSNAGNVTVRGFRMTYDTFSTGALSGTASGSSTLTGLGTLWTTDRIAAGARIGIGNVSPSAISTWYTIASIASNTSLTLTSPLQQAVTASSLYVIEELRAIMAVTNATAASGGLRVVKGLNYTDFVNNVSVAMASGTDNLKLCYWLADSTGNIQNQTTIGMGLLPKTDNTSHDLYILDGTTNLRIYKHNIRASLASLAVGRSVSSFIFATSGNTLTGTAGQVNNGRWGSHGIYDNYLWCTTTTRVYAIPVSTLAASSVFTMYAMTEVPPGGSNSFSATSTMSSVEIANSIDRLVVLTQNRGYIANFNTTAQQFDSIFLPETRQLDQSTASPDKPPILQSGTSTTNGLYVEDSWGYFCRGTTSSTTNQLYVFPFGAHWTYQSSAFTVGRVITPSITTANCSKYYRVYVMEDSYGGGDFRKRGEDYKLYYRTSGISDNSGSWTNVDNGDLSGVAGATAIQFMFEFKVLGDVGLTARIQCLTVLYETSEYLPAHLQWNFNDSSSASGIVGFSQITVYGSVPDLLINYYRSDTDANVLSQGSTGQTNGVFEYWTGSTWSSGLGTDVVGTRRRFRPTAGLPSGTELYTKLSVA